MAVGNTAIGGNNPVRVQSMTSTSTLDTRATVDQILRIASAGADIVRMTVQSKREAENLQNIKNELRSAGCYIPLVADVHFNPAIAETAAAIVDKVRINPGNYGISPKAMTGVFTESQYDDELNKAKEKFLSLIEICRKNSTALRVGVNHGSLSPRIISRYGNTPEGMVHSAMEFLRFCNEQDFNNVVVSLKSSNILVMVRSNRMISEYMMREGMSYPLHLGVTEAGEGEDGRIRSASGIGTLLSEGTGDTMRISLTEDPEREIPVAQMLLRHIEKHLETRESLYQSGSRIMQNEYSGKEISNYGPLSPESTSGGKSRFPGRRSFSVENIGGDQVPVVIGNPVQSDDPGTNYSSESAPDLIPGTDNFVTVTAGEYLQGSGAGLTAVFLKITAGEISDELLSRAAKDKNLVFVALSQTGCPPMELRNLIERLEKSGCSNPVIFCKEYNTEDDSCFQIAAATDFAPLFIDGLGEGLWLSNKVPGKNPLCVSTAFSILQSTRARISKTEFISCPSCGRTMFNIQDATAAVKSRLSHLRGLKIAVMGCIVNGPGEMADADYGYVGSGKGRVTLYKKQDVVRRNIPEEKAIDELISLIKESGDWKDD